jgi:hypothetical protein
MPLWAVSVEPVEMPGSRVLVPRVRLASTAMRRVAMAVLEALGALAAMAVMEALAERAA